MQTRSSEQSLSVEQVAPEQWPDQEHVVEGEEPVVVDVPEPPDRPRFFAREPIKLSPIERRVLKLVI